MLFISFGDEFGPKLFRITKAVPANNRLTGLAHLGELLVARARLLGMR